MVTQPEIHDDAKPCSLEDVERVLSRDVYVRNAILNVEEYDGTLVIFVEPDVPPVFVRTLVRPVWDGPVEVYCATALMTGSRHS